MCVRCWQQIAGQNENLYSHSAKLGIKYLQLKTSSRKVISSQVFALSNSFLKPINPGFGALKIVLSSASIMIPYLSCNYYMQPYQTATRSLLLYGLHTTCLFNFAQNESVLAAIMDCFP